MLLVLYPWKCSVLRRRCSCINSAIITTGALDLNVLSTDTSWFQKVYINPANLLLGIFQVSWNRCWWTVRFMRIQNDACCLYYLITLWARERLCDSRILEKRSGWSTLSGPSSAWYTIEGRSRPKVWNHVVLHASKQGKYPCRSGSLPSLIRRVIMDILGTGCYNLAMIVKKRQILSCDRESFTTSSQLAFEPLFEGCI